MIGPLQITLSFFSSFFKIKTTADQLEAGADWNESHCWSILMSSSLWICEWTLFFNLIFQHNHNYWNLSSEPLDWLNACTCAHTCHSLGALALTNTSIQTLLRVNESCGNPQTATMKTAIMSSIIHTLNDMPWFEYIYMCMWEHIHIYGSATSIHPYWMRETSSEQISSYISTVLMCWQCSLQTHQMLYLYN